MAKKKLAATVKIQIPAGQATPAPPVGTALGPHGINIMDFCNAYNAETEHQRGLVIPAVISIFEDRSFTFITKTPPTPFLIKRAAGAEKGAQNVRTEIAGEVTHDEVRRIAETKMPDVNALDLDGAIAQVEGTARSMGIKVVDKKGTVEITKRDDDDESGEGSGDDGEGEGEAS
jgi:large subunit ribosomal protein L11